MKSGHPLRRMALPGISLIGRLLVLASLLLALFPPPLPWTRAPLELIALVDESQSMPRRYNDSAWQQLLALQAEAPTGSRLRLVRFAAKPTVERLDMHASASIPTALPRVEPLDRGATDIAAALELALRLAPPGRPTVMLLVSDLAATSGDTSAALQALGKADIPVYLLTPPKAALDASPQLNDLQLPSRVNTGDEIPVVVSLTTPTGAPVTVTLDIDGRLQDSKRLTSQTGSRSLAYFHFPAQEPGTRVVTVRVTHGENAGDTGPHATRTAVVNVIGPAPVLYVTNDKVAGPVAISLQQGGWEVRTSSPPNLAGRGSGLQRAGVIILDNLAIGDMAEVDWKALVEAVRVQGKGLLVLGGPRSFGAGAYRHSQLEEILPVTAEPGQPQEPAAVVFLLDRSGSMGQAQVGPSRFSLARKAVESSVKMVLPNDYVGIITFATDAELRLPLAARPVDRARVSSATDVKPGGGTRLEPALRLAAAQLREIDAGQRLVVLVTDGFAGDEDLGAIADSLHAEGVTVIALAVGSEPNLATLQQLTAFNDGRVMPVSDVATLPRLMSTTIATRRAPAVGEATVPLLVKPLPFEIAPDAAWPPLSAYMVSKARPAAQAYLQSSQGDPLLATGLAGAGRVAVLTAGLGDWAGSWWQWAGFGPFLGGLVQWLEPGLGAAGISMAVADEPGLLVFTIDMQTGGAWDSGQQPRLLVDDPSGTRTELIPVLQAPGRYIASLVTTRHGLYQATLLSGEHSLKQAVWRDNNREFQGLSVAQLQLKAWLEQGRLQTWPGIEEVLEAAPRDAAGLRTVLLALALLSYLLVLVLERGLGGPLIHWLHARFSR